MWILTNTSILAAILEVPCILKTSDGGASISRIASWLLLVWQLLPRYALAGYLILMYITEIFNLILSAGRLRRCLAQAA